MAMRLRQSRVRTIEGANYGTPKEVWGFRSPRGKGSALNVARAFLKANTDLLGLDENLRGLAYQKTIRSLGAQHVIFQQHHAKVRVHRAYVTVHIGERDKRVYLTKNRAVPDAMLPKRPKTAVTRASSVSIARREIGSTVKGVKVLGADRIWLAVDGDLHLTWRVRLHRTTPREEWIHYIDAVTGEVRSSYDNLAAANGRAWVFDPNPVVTLDGSDQLLTANGNPRRKIPDDAYFEVRLRGLKEGGRLDGSRVTTKHTKPRVRRKNGDFFFEARSSGFEESMVYYHIDTAIRYLEQLGFRGARAIFREPLEVAVNGTSADNSWYSPGLKRLTFGTGSVDDAEDAETILHEFGHALQDAIIPDFGQSEEAAAMGEGFGDYFAASFFAEQKSATYRPTVMSWDGVTWTENDPPCVRRVDNEWTYADFIPGDGEHNNGEIWSATLWDIRKKLGREVADQIILESHFQLDGFTDFARGARAIVDADRNLNGGGNAAAIRKVFRDRGIGPL